MDEPKGFYVEPKDDCPHVDTAFTPDEKLVAVFPCPCATCGDEKENWACLKCNKKFCSRYIKGHMQEHNTETGHPLAVSYSDMSFWCYSCDSYITDPRFNPLLKLMAVAKFGDAGTGGRYTAHATKAQLEEKHDSAEDLEKKIKKLAAMIRRSKHLIAFTGAGVSTSAGIPDFRGPQGVWTLKATGQRRTERTVPFLSAMPSTCHMALVKLSQEGILKFLISQNVDGLHRRSGIPPHQLAELHGNTNMEVCSKCAKEYMRDFECMKGSSMMHVTGRKCSVAGCDGILLDTIINFGESLPVHFLQRGFEEAEEADLCIALGSSLGVTPAADMPKRVAKRKKNKGKLVIVNLQKTPLDDLAALRIFGRCDEVMEGVMKELGMETPPFMLQRQIIVGHDERGRVTVEAIDTDGTPLSLFCGVEVIFAGSGRKEGLEADDADGAFVFTRQEGDGDDLEVKLYFFGHYNEPPLALKYSMGAGEKGGVKKYVISYQPATGEWQPSEEKEATEAELSRGKASMSEEEMRKNFPRRLHDDRHDEHPLVLTPTVYGGGYRCNGCMDIGTGWVYTCAECQYDLHPGCALWRRGVKN